MIHTTFNQLHEAGACIERYRHLAKSLGGIKEYGCDKSIGIATILEHNGLDDALWALCACSPSELAEKIARLFAADCAEHALLREREAGREPHKDSWGAVAAARAFTRGEIDTDELARAARAAGAAGATGAAGAASAASAASAAWAAGAASAARAARAARAAWAAGATGAAGAASAAWAAWAAWAAEEKWQAERLLYWAESEGGDAKEGAGHE